MPDDSTESAGDRLLKIRAARGDGVYPESQPAFIAAYNKRHGTDYDATWLSRRETGRTPITVEEAVQFAAMDPLKRGAAWVAFGGEAVAEPTADRPVPRPMAEVLEPYKPRRQAPKNKRA